MAKLKSPKTYLLFDSANTFFRARHVVRGDDIETKTGLALHICFNSVKKCWERFKADHVVFCFEGRSWRKDAYEPYKQNRKVTRDAMTPAEQEADKVFWESFDSFHSFVTDKTNATVLQHKQLEADDFIAGWIQAHPDDKHVIVSSDSDFYQLLSDNVSQYNGITDTWITIDGFIDERQSYH
jgi:5'-3' exonuclease